MKNYYVDLASLADKKLVFDFAKEMKFDLKAMGIKPTRDRTLIKLLKSPGLVFLLQVFQRNCSQKYLFSENPDELCGRLEILIQKKQETIQV